MGETGVGCRVQSNFMLASLRMAQSNSCRNKPELLMGSLNSRLLSPATVTATTAIASMAHFHFLPETSFVLESMNHKKTSQSSTPIILSKTKKEAKVNWERKYNFLSKTVLLIVSSIKCLFTHRTYHLLFTKSRTLLFLGFLKWELSITPLLDFA